jgi:hypothetical protein
LLQGEVHSSILCGSTIAAGLDRDLMQKAFDLGAQIAD